MEGVESTYELNSSGIDKASNVYTKYSKSINNTNVEQNNLKRHCVTIYDEKKSYKQNEVVLFIRCLTQINSEKP